jgi:hypothetical protein
VSFRRATDHAFELYVFAALQCGGWFVEHNPRDEDLIAEYLFELDAVAGKPFGDRGRRLLAVCGEERHQLETEGCPPASRAR